MEILAAYLRVEREHGLDRHGAGVKVVRLEHALHQVLPVLERVERRLGQQDLVPLGVDLRCRSPPHHQTACHHDVFAAKLVSGLPGLRRKDARTFSLSKKV